MRRHHTRAALTALAGTCAVALAAPMAQAAPMSPTAVLPSTLTVECTGIGAVTVHTHGGTLTGATTDAGPVSMAGVQVSSVPAGQSGATAAQQGSVPASATTCDPVTLRNVPASSVLGSGSRAVDATVRFGVRVDVAQVIQDAARHPLRASYMAAAASNDPAGYGPVRAFPSTWGMQGYIRTAGNLDVAYRAAGEKVIHVGTHGQTAYVSASIAKLQIMAAVMHQAQAQGRALSTWEKSQLVPMITRSDNDAATALWHHVGSGSGVASIVALMGLRGTVPRYDHWGLTVTTAADQVVLVDHFARPNPVLNATNRAYGLSLMRMVSTDQNWGITAGPGTDNAVKNGWLTDPNGCHVNSVGYLDDAPRHYTMAVLSQSPTASMSTLIGRIQTTSRLVWNHQRGVRGDFTGDGRADLMAVRSGSLVMAASTGSGFAAPRTVGSGWGGVKWIGTPGDLNGDGISDVLAIFPSGHLWFYPGTGGASLGRGRDLGRGWGQLNQLVTPGDFTGDGVPDLIGRDARGQIILYTTHGTASPTRTRVLAPYWGGLRTLLGSGDFNNDGRGDILGITPQGQLIAYASTGSGISRIRVVGNGWPTTGVGTIGDVDGNEVADIAEALPGQPVKVWTMNPGATLGRTITTNVSSTGMTRAF